MQDLFKKLKIGDLIPKFPIIQGGMGVGISLSGLTAAVANAGGIGVISTAGIGVLTEGDYDTLDIEVENEMLQKVIRETRKLTDGVIGVNIMVALTNFANLVKTAIEEKIDVIFAGAGLPLNLPEYLTKDSTTKLVPIISSARATKIICKKWFNSFNYLPDAVVVEGPMAGGHIGFKREQIEDPEFQLEKLVPAVVNELKLIEEEYGKHIPVIAAGGIYYGSDFQKYFDLGAEGIQMGTRFVTTDECDASEKFKQAFIDSTEEDNMIIQSPVGLPGRALRNKFLEDVENGKKQPFKCPYHCIRTCKVDQSPYCIALALLSAMRGDWEHGFAFAGKNAYKTDKIIPVKEVFQNLLDEYLASKTDKE